MRHLNPIIGDVLASVLEAYKEHVIAIYGIGSFFDDSLPDDWTKNDLDLIVILDDLSIVPKKDWTDARFDTFKRDGIEVFIGYNTLDAYKDKKTFQEQSFANYEWALTDLKNPENSQLIYGKDVREHMPDIRSLTYDLKDLLIRALYHFDKSCAATKQGENESAMSQFSKALFKFGFYLSVFKDPDFRSTSIREISKKVQEIVKTSPKFKDNLLDLLKESIKYRRTETFRDFERIRKRFTAALFSLLGKGVLHERMTYQKLREVLTAGFGDGRAFTFLVNILDALKKKHAP